MALFRFLDWPLRAKMAALLAVASFVPLAVAAFIDIRETHQRMLEATGSLLAARGDQLAGELDDFNQDYLVSAHRLAQVPEVVDFFLTGSHGIDRPESAKPARREILAFGDDNVRGVGLLDLSGVVRLATEDQLVGVRLAFHPYVREALRGATVVSNLHFAELQVGNTPTIAYLAPVRGPERKMIGLAAVWVRAASFWEILKRSNALAGPGSFAVLFDHQGIRMAHTYSSDIVFHPGGKLDSVTLEALVAERRFGDKTRAFLEDVKAFPKQFDYALAKAPDRGLFRGFAPVNQKWSYGVARRLQNVPWTVFYMLPEDSIEAEIAKVTRQKAVFGSGIILAALIAGILCATFILKPIRQLSQATGSLGRGDLAARVHTGNTDEIGKLGTSFNAMAERIAAQTTALQKARNELEKRVEERTAALQQTTQSLATTLNSIGDAVIATDTEGRVVRMNPVAETLTGWPLAEALGRSLAEIFRIFNEETRQRAESPVVRVLREGLVVGLANHTALISRDGAERPIADSGAPIRDAEGRITGVVLVFRDQTEERKAEELRVKGAHLELENLRIQEASRLKSEFLANMSHELRTPLNAIIGFAELMHDGKVGPVSESHKEYLNDVLTSAHHLLQLINDVLDLSKVEAGKMEFHPEPVDLAKIIGESLGILRTTIAAKAIRVEAQVDAGLTDIEVDASRLKQVLYNYLSNALKFTPAGGRVTVRAIPGTDASSFRLEVEDTGIGIAPEDLGRLFVEFQQLDAGTAKKHGGTGLGLALTRSLVEAQGGTTGVRSSLGEGSVFHAILPRRSTAGG